MANRIYGVSSMPGLISPSFSTARVGTGFLAIENGLESRGARPAAEGLVGKVISESIWLGSLAGVDARDGGVSYCAGEGLLLEASDT